MLTVFTPGRVSTTSVEPAAREPLTVQDCPVVRFCTVTSWPGPSTVTTGQAGTSPVIVTVKTANASEAPRISGRNGNQFVTVEPCATVTVDSRFSSQYGQAARNSSAPTLKS